MRSEIAIVGAGLVGSTLAVSLARHGIPSVLIDRLDPGAALDAAFDGRASAIAASSQTLLSAIGVWPHVAAPEPIREIRVSDGNAPFFLHYDHALLGDGPLGYMAENRDLRRALTHAIAAHGALITVRAGRAVTDFSDDADAATLTLDNGETVTARLAVAAEGRESGLRDKAGIAVTAWRYAQVGIVATIGHERPHRGIAHERFLPVGPFAILPLADDAGVHRASLVWTERADMAAHYLALDERAFLNEIAERVGGFLGDLSLIGPRFSHPLGLQFAARYTKGRLALIGDAAHAIHPIAGQGLNLGLRDVAALSEIIVEAGALGLDPAHPEGLARYERWRRGDNLLMAGVTDALNRLFSNEIAPIRVARDLGLAAVNRIGPLKRFFMRHAMGHVGDLPRLMRGVPLR
jgi:2-octaprenyl-6-methoxyphenol hydroxylase